MKQAIIFLLVLLTATGYSAKQTSSNEEYYQLNNGLSVILRPVDGAKSIAMITIYSIGENDDPVGKSGMGHLIEHLYVTAATGNTESRNIQTFMSQYSGGWNAQTGKDYTIIAMVFPKERIGAELKDAAARMSKLIIKASDLKREIPRIENELSNMHGGIPALAAKNLASDMVVHHYPNRRKGGMINQIKSIDIKQLQKRIKIFYKPQNAMIIIAGAIEPEQVKRTISKTFSEIQRGQKMGVAPLLPKPALIMSVSKQVLSRISQPQPYVALAFKAPNPADNLYPAFLVLVARIQANSYKLTPPQGVYPVGFALLDAPEVITVSLPVLEGEKPGDVIEQLTNYISATVIQRLNSQDINNTKNIFGYMLGLRKYSDRMLKNNIYGVAFTIGMQKHLGIDRQKLLNRINSITPDELTKAVKKYFAAGKYARAIVNIK